MRMKAGDQVTRLWLSVPSATVLSWSTNADMLALCPALGGYWEARVRTQHLSSKGRAVQQQAKLADGE